MAFNLSVWYTEHIQVKLNIHIQYVKCYIEFDILTESTLHND